VLGGLCRGRFERADPGVTIAATTKMSRMAYLVCLSRNFGVTSPTRARNITSVGISNTSPRPRAMRT